MTRRVKIASTIGLAFVAMPILLSETLPSSENLEMIVGGTLILFAPPYTLLMAYVSGSQATTHVLVSAAANAILYGLGGLATDRLGGKTWPVTLVWILYLSLLVFPW